AGFQPVLPHARSRPRAADGRGRSAAHLPLPGRDGRRGLALYLQPVRQHPPPAGALPMKAPPVSITCQDLTLRFPVYGVDAKSLKKSLAKITVGGRLGRSHGATEVTAISGLNMELRAGDRLGLVGHNGSGKTTL